MSAMHNRHPHGLAAMAQQMLRVHRRSASAPSSDHRRSIHELAPLLQGFVGPRVAVEVMCPAPVSTTEMSDADFECMVLSLVLRARDVVSPEGGRISVEVQDAWPAAPERQRLGLPEGRMVRVVVADDGPALSRAALDRLFEPGPTHARSPGFGLHEVRRSVRGVSGRLTVRSEHGGGTAFTVLLPVHEPQGAPAASS